MYLIALCRSKCFFHYDENSQAVSRSATHCHALPLTATHCHALPLTATHCYALLRTATHCHVMIRNNITMSTRHSRGAAQRQMKETTGKHLISHPMHLYSLFKQQVSSMIQSKPKYVYNTHNPYRALYR